MSSTTPVSCVHTHRLYLEYALVRGGGVANGHFRSCSHFDTGLCLDPTLFVLCWMIYHDSSILRSSSQGVSDEVALLSRYRSGSPSKQHSSSRAQTTAVMPSLPPLPLAMSTFETHDCLLRSRVRTTYCKADKTAPKVTRYGETKHQKTFRHVLTDQSRFAKHQVTG
jgi:hypothetical protein